MDTSFLEYLLNQNAQNWADTLGVGSPGFRRGLDQFLNTPRSGFDNFLGGQKPSQNDWIDAAFALGQERKLAQQAANQKATKQPVQTQITPQTSQTSIATKAPNQITLNSSEMGVPSHATEGPAKWLPLVHQYGQQYGVPDDVILGIMDIESGGNPEAQGAQTKWGKAQGLMQIMPFHWEPGTPENVMRNPAENIKKGIEILAKNYQIYGNWQSAAAAYFGAVDANGNPTTETDANGVNGIQYVQKFENARGKYKPGW